MLHATLGKPIRFFGTAGQRSDYMKALDLIDGQKMSAWIADKGYDAHGMVDAAKGVHAKVLYRHDLKEELQETMIKNDIKSANWLSVCSIN